MTGRGSFQADSCVRWPGVVPKDALRRVRAAMAQGTSEPAELLADDVRLDATVRDAVSIDVDDETLAFVETCLDAHRARLESAFGLSLGQREGPSFLRYSAGGGYRPHRDRGETLAWPAAARRRIAVVLFLNSSRVLEADGEFEGGCLRLLAEPGWPAVDVYPRAGTLVAFSADRLHEVTPVRAGIRETIVDWFY